MYYRTQVWDEAAQQWQGIGLNGLGIAVLGLDGQFPDYYAAFLIKNLNLWGSKPLRIVRYEG